MLMNKLKTIHNDAFAQMIEIETVNLMNNQLEFLQAELFASNKKLIKLMLSDNRIKSIDGHFFHALATPNEIGFSGNICVDTDMYHPNEFNQLQRSIDACITRSQRMQIEKLKSLPAQVKNDFNNVEKAWNNLLPIHAIQQTQLNSITMLMNNLSDAAQLTDENNRKILSRMEILKTKVLAFDFDRKYSLANGVLSGKFIMLLVLQIISFIFFIITMASIIYGMWKISQKAI